MTLLLITRDVRGLNGNLDVIPPVMSATPPTSASVTTTTATANWSAATDNVAVTGYNLYNATPPTGGGAAVPVFIDSTVVGTRTYALTGLLAGQDNVIWITALDAAGNESDPSVLTITTTGVTDTTAPSVPSGLTADSNTTTTQTFHWSPSTDSESGVDHYIVLRNASAVNSNVPGTSYTDTGLTANTAYTYTVKAVDGAGNTSAASSGLVMTTDPGTDTTKPSNVTGLAASNIRVNQIDLAWNAATDNSGSIANYKLYWNAGSGTTAGTLWKTLPGTAVTFTATGLTANTTYAFAVTAVDPAGNESNAKSPTILPKTLASGGTGILFMLQATNQKDKSSGNPSLTKLGDRTAANGWKTASGAALVDASGNATNLGGTRMYYSPGTFPTAFSASATTGGSGTNTNKRVQICWKGNSGFQNFVDVMNGGADIAYCRFLNSIPAGWEVAMTFHHEPQNDFDGTNNTPAQYKSAQMRLGALLEGRNPTTLGLPAKNGGAAAISLNSGVIVYNEICFTIPPSATTNQWPTMKNALPLASQMDAGAKVCLDAYQNPPPSITAAVPAGGINALYPTPASVWNYFLNNILHAYGYDAAGHGYTVGEWMAPARTNDNANHDGQTNAINSYLTFLENNNPPPYAIRMWEDKFSITDGSNAQFNQTAFAGAKQAFVTHALGVNART